MIFIYGAVVETSPLLLQIFIGLLYQVGSGFLAAKPEAPCSIPGATRFSEYQCVWNGVHSTLVRINEELLERKVAAPV
jgi:hypothetical protein